MDTRGKKTDIRYMYNLFMYIKKFKTNINVKFLQCWTKRWLIWETISNEFRQEFLLRKQRFQIIGSTLYLSQNYIWQWMLIIIWYEIQSMFLIYLLPFIYIFIREKPGFIHWIKVISLTGCYCHTENIKSVIFTVK